MTTRSVLVSGACGNLGRKVIEALAETPWCGRIVGLDRHDDLSGFSASARSRLVPVVGDLTRPEPGWRQALAGRFVFASSNHVMGGYKDPPLADSMGPGRLTRTMTYAGNHKEMPAGDAMSEDDRRSLRWYRNMWLSNADLGALFAAAVTAESGGWPSRAIIVNGVSRNRDTDWDLASTRTLIGYTPRDDLYDHVAAG